MAQTNWLLFGQCCETVHKVQAIDQRYVMFQPLFPLLCFISSRRNDTHHEGLVVDLGQFWKIQLQACQHCQIIFSGFSGYPPFILIPTF